MTSNPSIRPLSSTSSRGGSNMIPGKALDVGIDLDKQSRSQLQKGSSSNKIISPNEHIMDGFRTETSNKAALNTVKSPPRKFYIQSSPNPVKPSMDMSNIKHPRSATLKPPIRKRAMEKALQKSNGTDDPGDGIRTTMTAKDQTRRAFTEDEPIASVPTTAPASINSRSSKSLSLSKSEDDLVVYGDIETNHESLQEIKSIKKASNKPVEETSKSPDSNESNQLFWSRNSNHDLTLADANNTTSGHAKSKTKAHLSDTAKCDRPESRKLYLNGPSTLSPDPRPALRGISRCDSTLEANMDDMSEVDSRNDASDIMSPASTEGIAPSPSWIFESGDNVIPVQRPPSRQSSAFPIHLADDDLAAKMQRQSNRSRSNSQAVQSSGSIEDETSPRSLNPLRSIKSSSTGSEPRRAATATAMLQTTSPSSISNESHGSFHTHTTGATDLSSDTKISSSYSEDHSTNDLAYDQDVDASEVLLDRPPSRQRIGAQHLFDKNRSNDLTENNPRSLSSRNDGNQSSDSELSGETANIKVASMFPPHPSTAPAAVANSLHGTSNSMLSTMNSMAKKQLTSINTSHGMNNNNFLDKRPLKSAEIYGNVSQDPFADGFMFHTDVTSLNNNVDLPFKVDINYSSNNSNNNSISPKALSISLSPANSPSNLRMIEAANTGPAIKKTIRQSRSTHYLSPSIRQIDRVDGPSTIFSNSRPVTSNQNLARGSRGVKASKGHENSFDSLALWENDHKFANTINADLFDDEDLIVLPNKNSNGTGPMSWVESDIKSPFVRPSNPPVASIDRLMTASAPYRSTEQGLYDGNNFNISLNSDKYRYHNDYGQDDDDDDDALVSQSIHLSIVIAYKLII